MAVSFVAHGAFASGAPSCGPTRPAGAATDILIACLMCKPYTAPTPTNADHTALAAYTNGTVASGVDTGSVKTSTLRRTTSPTTQATDTFTATGASPILGTFLRFAKGSGTWDVATFDLSDSDESTVVVTTNSGDTASADEIRAGDMLCIAVGIRGDAITHTSQVISVAGCVLDTITWQTKGSTTAGNDGSLYVGHCLVTSGSSLGEVSYTATASLAAGAAVNMVRLREVTATPASFTGWGVPL